MIKTKPWTGGTEEEYETQHFGFGAQRFKIAVRQMVEEKIKTGVKDMVEFMKNSLDLNDTDKATLIQSCNNLIRLYCERAEPSLQNIDSEIERVLKIPSNVLLPEDEVQSEQVTEQEYEKLKEEVASLRKRVERGALMETLLSTQVEEISSIEKVCVMAQKDMDVVDSLFRNVEGSDNTLKAIQMDTQVLCASVPFMEQKKSFCD